MSCESGRVTEMPLAGHGEESAVVVQVTPRDYRTRAVAFIAGGLLLTTISVLLTVLYGRTPDLVIGPAAVGYCLVPGLMEGIKPRG